MADVLLRPARRPAAFAITQTAGRPKGGNTQCPNIASLCRGSRLWHQGQDSAQDLNQGSDPFEMSVTHGPSHQFLRLRSEVRRVGKEWYRSVKFRLSRYHEKKKK